VGVAGGSAAVVSAARAQPLVVFFEHPTYGIPAIPATGLATGLPDLDAWRVQPTRFGYVAAVAGARSRGRGRWSRAVWTMAACVPLTVLSTAARAEAPPEPVKVRAPTIPPPPSRSVGPEEDVAPDEGPADGETTPDAEPAPEVASESEVAPPVPNCVDPGVSSPMPSTAAVLDAAWEGVVGYDVVLTLASEQKIAGRITAVQDVTFTMIDRENGVVRVMRKVDVDQLRVNVPGPLPKKDGTGLLAGGGVLMAVGSPVFLSGVVFLGVCPSCTYFHVPMLLVGGAAIGAGIPMLVRGTRRRQAANAARDGRWLPTPTISATRHGWTGGLRLRF
jgi:hypothetical protein